MSEVAGGLADNVSGGLGLLLLLLLLLLAVVDRGKIGGGGEVGGGLAVAGPEARVK